MSSTQSNIIDLPRLLEQVNASSARFRQGEVLRARAEMERLFQEAQDARSAAGKLIVAHFFADMQAEVESELNWDLIALAEAQSCPLDTIEFGPEPVEVRSLMPSLHLNAGDAYRRIGRPDLARQHVRAGYRYVDALPNNEYGKGIRSALDRLHSRLELAQAPPRAASDPPGQNSQDDVAGP